MFSDQVLNNRLFRAFIDQSPMAMALFVGPELIIRMANQSVLEYWNRTREAVLNKPLFEALPEAAGQGLEELLTRVYTTGERFVAKERSVDLLRNGRLERTYIDFVYDPFYETDPTTGTDVITGITVTCTEVTGTVTARQKLAEEQRQLLALFDQSPVAIALIDAEQLTFRMVNPFYGYLAGRSPDELVGKPMLEALPELREQGFGDLLNNIIATGESFNANEVAVSVVRNGQLETIYVHVTYLPQRAADGSASGLLVVCTDVTQQVLARKAIEESEARFRSLIREAPAAILVVRGNDLVIETVNQALLRMLDRGEDIVGKPLEVVMPELIGQSLPAKCRSVLTTGVAYYGQEVEGQAVRNGRLETGYFSVSYTPLVEEGLVTGVMQVVVEVTQQVLARRAAEESEARFRSLVEESPVATCLFTGPDLVIDVANENMIRFFGRGPDIVGKPVGAVLAGHPGDTSAIALLTQVYNTGEPFTAMAAPADLTINGVPGTYYFDLSLKPLRNAAGAVYAILETAAEVTERVLARQKVEESEVKFRLLIDEAPVATALFLGREMTIEVANDTMIGYWGKTDAVLGKTFSEAVPELEGQSFFTILDEVFTTGKAYHESAARADVLVNGVLGTYYFNYTFKPLRNAAGVIYGVLDTAVDVTEQVLARQKLEEAESGLRVAIGLAELGTWSIDVATNGLTYSERLIEWFGYDPQGQDYSQVIPILDPRDQERVAQSVAWALDPRSGGDYEETYTVIHPQTGRKRILHAQGKTVFNATGKAVRLNGTAQDITGQRELQLALEQQVQERTKELAGANQQLAATVDELASANEELAAINEELLASNEETIAANNELSEANNLLNRSNSNLEKFAYIASHDLQEPLRKIQSFGDLLKNQYADQLGDGVPYLERMQLAASRMSTLIRDLLAYSRIATQQETVDTVSLNAVVASVLNDLDLRIQETEATVNIVPLPIIQGDRSQLEQLFQNLFSNALKFRRADVKPVIEVTCRLVYPHELPPTVKPARMTKLYRCIDVADNGIGFDEKYVDRIFQVFQRLHGKNEFSGTGIGLAICEKVVTNHGGAITATSQPGQGTTFSVYFPG